MRLSVFVDGWTLEAAEKVTGGLDARRRSQAPTLETLAVLVDRSLVVRREYAGEGRFALLEPVREYALEILAARCESARMQAQHAKYYLSLALKAEPRLEANGMELSPAERADFDQAAAALRTRLGEAELATEWQQGRAMTIEQKVEYALENLSSLGRPEE